ncbi:MAG: glycosyltransferase family 2 protein [Rhodoferax sp.]
MPMTTVPLLSVVVPIHNGAELLPATVDSIFSQTHTDFELILVDDASNDRLQEVLNAYPDRRLRVEHLVSNVGVANARNHGVAVARGRYIAFCDADDLCLPQRFERQLGFLQSHPEVGICGSAFTCFDDHGDLETVRHPVDNDVLKSSLMTGNCFGTSTIMGRAELFKAHTFDQSMSPTEDYDLWTRLAGYGVGLANLEDSLLRYRVHAAQASQRKSELLDRLSRKIRALYCARLLSDAVLVDHMRSETLCVTDLQTAAADVERYCQHHVVSAPQFRHMLAWIYQQLPAHGWSTWYAWRRIRAQLGLRLDRNYRFNIGLLALLPKPIARRYGPVLLKLKR